MTYWNKIVSLFNSLLWCGDLCFPTSLFFRIWKEWTYSSSVVNWWLIELPYWFAIIFLLKNLDEIDNILRIEREMNASRFYSVKSSICEVRFLPVWATNVKFIAPWYFFLFLLFYSADKLLHGDFTSCKKLQLSLTNSSHPCANNVLIQAMVFDSANDLNDESIHQGLLVVNLETMGSLDRHRLFSREMVTGLKFPGRRLCTL